MAGRSEGGSAGDKGLRDVRRRHWKGENGRSQLRGRGSQRAVKLRSKQVI
jgi:hypothetical protein